MPGPCSHHYIYAFPAITCKNVLYPFLCICPWSILQAYSHWGLSSVFTLCVHTRKVTTCIQCCQYMCYVGLIFEFRVVSVLLVQKCLSFVAAVFLEVELYFELIRQRRLLSCIQGTLDEGIHLQAVNSKGLASVRWHPETVHWCITLNEILK